MTLPLITIGITAYRAADTIGRAIQSAVAQKWENTEILIVDDFSGDSTVDAIYRAITDLKQARLIVHETNTGPAGARNTILHAARGEFIAFFDDDDESYPERLHSQYERIIAYERDTGAGLVLCYASGERLYPNGYRKDLPAIGSQGIAPQGRDMADRTLFFGGDKTKFYGSGTPTCSLMARKSTFEAVGGFDKNFRRVEDLDFSVRCALKGAHFTGGPQKLFLQHATESSDKSHEKNLEAELQLVEKHKAYLQSRKQYHYARQWPQIRYSHFKKDYKNFIIQLFGLWIRHPFQTTRHIVTTGPARFLHERKMNKKQLSNSTT